MVMSLWPHFLAHPVGLYKILCLYPSTTLIRTSSPCLAKIIRYPTSPPNFFSSASGNSHDSAGLALGGTCPPWLRYCFSRTTWVSWYKKGKTTQPGFEWGKRRWGLGMQWHQLDHVQTICTSLQTDNHTNTASLNFYRPDALPGAQPTVSKHWRQRGRHMRGSWKQNTRDTRGVYAI